MDTCANVTSKNVELRENYFLIQDKCVTKTQTSDPENSDPSQSLSPKRSEMFISSSDLSLSRPVDTKLTSI